MRRIYCCLFILLLCLPPIAHSGLYPIKSLTPGGPLTSLAVDNNNVWDNLPPYSEDMFATLSVAERMTQLGYEDAYSWDQYGGGIYTRAEAICKRALLVVLGLFDDKVDV